MENSINQVYTPIVIPDVPFPQQVLQPDSLSSSMPNSGQGVQTTQEQTFPEKRVSYEVMSSALNTKSRKIMQDFSFTRQGALQIGNFQEGQTGDISITPNGIVARNLSGETTFALDGDSGDAVFSGQLKSGSVVTGQVVVGDSSIIIDGQNTQINVFNATGKNTVRIDSTGLIGFNTAGTEIMHLRTTALEFYGISGNIINLLDSAGGTVWGKMGYDTGAASGHSIALSARGSLFLFNYDDSANFSVIKSTIQLGTGSPNFQDILISSIHGDVNINAGGNVNVTAGTFNINGSPKTAIVPTTEGYKALYCSESPELWFFDFAKDGESIDPLFMEVTEGEMKTVKTVDGDLLIFRRRRGYPKTRFENKSIIDFERNNKFWARG